MPLIYFVHVTLTASARDAAELRKQLKRSALCSQTVLRFLSVKHLSPDEKVFSHDYRIIQIDPSVTGIELRAVGVSNA